MRVAIRWQVVQRSRTLLGSTQHLLGVRPATRRPPAASPSASAASTFVSSFASSVRNSQSAVAAASTSSVSGVGRPLPQEGLDSRGRPSLGQQAAGVAGRSGPPSAAGPRAGTPAAAAGPPGCTGRPWRGSGRRSGRRGRRDAVPPPVVEQQADRLDRLLGRDAHQRRPRPAAPCLAGVSPS